MKEKKVYFLTTMLFLCGFMIFSVINAGQVSAKASAIVIATSDGSKYEYNYDELKQSAASYYMGDTVEGALYSHFMNNKTSIEAYFDNSRNVYVPNSAIQSEALSKMMNNLNFDFVSFMENPSTPTETLSTLKLKNNSGTVQPVDSTSDENFDLDGIE
ncbi:hypothetical protein HBE96_21005 [Clostridium sp. P21]|uniref:Uncharacterized protein n=1 Tax=Clostridium muellerianum TaxID=2716538 RepID=A0A7Y0EKC4_9CLOT|nr:hypothetical protein [Clostridium muellerianum]NMM65066.1 hypothetical protein [Clostridium muellerianum]